MFVFYLSKLTFHPENARKANITIFLPFEKEASASFYLCMLHIFLEMFPIERRPFQLAQSARFRRKQQDGKGQAIELLAFAVHVQHGDYTEAATLS